MPRHSEVTLAAIKHAVDIVTLAGEYLQNVTRTGSRYKALCPFHDDHHPSLVLDPDRQSYKCWSCGAGGDVFDFVKEIERVEFPEAVRLLAERAGVALDEGAAAAPAAGGASKTELFAVNAWAEAAFAEALARSEVARAYVGSRGLTEESVARFRLGYAPGERGWLIARARAAGYPAELLERAGLVARPSEGPGGLRERFRGRLIFPIHDPRGRTVGFGGRVLPEVEAIFAASGKRVAKYLNSPETPLFQKRRVLFAADLARTAARQAGWVAVVEGYTDVIAMHQAGLQNVVGTLGTALGDDHVALLRRLADRVVVVFDGDSAGRNAADRALELFLGHEVDMRVLTLPGNLDPADFVLKDGPQAFRDLVGRAVDPLTYAVARASERHDVESIEGARQAAEWVLGVIAKVPVIHRHGVDLKVAKAIDVLSRQLGLPVSSVQALWRQLRSPRRRPAPAAEAAAGGGEAAEPFAPSQFNREDRELIEVLLNNPALVPRAVCRVPASALTDPPLRTLLEAMYDLHAERKVPTFDLLTLRLNDPRLRNLAAGLLLPTNLGEVARHPIDPMPLKLADGGMPASWETRFDAVLARLAERDRQERIRAVREAMQEARHASDTETYRALHVELARLMSQRPVKQKLDAS